MKDKRWPRLIQSVLVLALPIALLAANVRIATGHWFIRWEYGKANFPPDPYGLSTAERTHLAQVCVYYLATSADISLLGELQLPGGEPAFNARELRHMADVQIVYNYLMVIGIVAALILVGGITALLVAKYPRHRAPAALLNGSLLTLGLLGIVGAYMVLNWGDFFTMFHRIFFEGDTWTFPFSDTLIRLFPMRFWIDVAVVIVGPLIIEAIAIGAIGWMWRRRINSETRYSNPS